MGSEIGDIVSSRVESGSIAAAGTGLLPDTATAKPELSKNPGQPRSTDNPWPCFDGFLYPSLQGFKLHGIFGDHVKHTLC